VGNTHKIKARTARVIKKLKKLFPSAGMALHYKNHWELFVAVVLSAQCTDKKVNEVTKNLFQKYKTLDDYVRANPSEFAKDIRSIGLYRSKTKNILAAAKMVKEKFGRRLPNTMEEMLTLPGAGRKTANVVLGNAYGVVEGIAVDTHVRRLARLMGLTKHNDPKKIELDLMQIVPRKDWFQFTYLMIEYGRSYCPARPHDHKNCPLGGSA
jgi:endonuclease-3